MVSFLLKNKQVSITHQLIYKNLGERSRLYVTTPKTEVGIRDIPNVSYQVCKNLLKY